MASVVLLSGGLDSAVNLAWAAQEDEVCLALTIDYGQRAAKREIEASRRLCQHYRVSHEIIQLDFLGKITPSALVNRDRTVPQESLEAMELAREEYTRQVWVPNRNGLLLNLAACYAEVLEAAWVVAGFNAEEGAAFPDNSPPFVTAVNQALCYSTLNKVKVKSYTLHLDKTQIVAKGREMAVPLQDTWSCYLEGPHPCGCCESCRRVARAMVEGGARP